MKLSVCPLDLDEANAIEIARQHGEGKQMTRVYVYNHEGKELSGGFGTY